MKDIFVIFFRDISSVSVSLNRAAPEFLVSVFISAEDILNWTQNSFEGAPLNAHNLREGQCFDAGLPGDVSD